MLNVKVARKTVEAIDICSYELRSVDGSDLPPFSAGAHIDVEIRPGLVRQYSLANSGAERDRYLIGVLKDPNSRGGSVGMHEAIEEGTVVRISEPKNHFPLDHSADHSILLAGGIGVTPILAMAHELRAQGRSFEMHYCARTRNRAAFLDQIDSSLFSDKVAYHFDDGADAQKLKIVDVLGAPHLGRHLYVCGPSGFLDFVIEMAKKQGWAEGNIHFEYFSAKIAASDTDQAFDVQLARRGLTVHVPLGKTIVQALSEAGVDVPMSCEQGVCGTCLTRVVSGTPDHKDQFLTDAEKAAKDQILVCCSRSKDPLLVLDL